MPESASGNTREDAAVAGFKAVSTVGLILLTVVLLPPLAPVVKSNAAENQVAEYQQMLNQYCVFCHNNQLANAGLILPALTLDSIPQEAETWEKVIRKLHARAMPPLDVPRPDENMVQGLLALLEDTLDRSALDNPNPGRVSAFHRLNRTEYNNSVRDILDLEYDAAALLPPDDSGYGFDNIADVLNVSPMLTER